MEPVSLQTLCEQVKITLKPGAATKTFNDPGAHHYRVTLEYKGRKLPDVEFHTGSGWKVDPSARDVLDCLLSDAESGAETFDDFCANLGYDTDSRKALNQYLECHAIGAKVRRLLGADYKTFAYAER